VFCETGMMNNLWNWPQVYFPVLFISVLMPCRAIHYHTKMKWSHVYKSEDVISSLICQLSLITTLNEQAWYFHFAWGKPVKSGIFSLFFCCRPVACRSTLFMQLLSIHFLYINGFILYRTSASKPTDYISYWQNHIMIFCSQWHNDKEVGALRAKIGPKFTHFLQIVNKFGITVLLLLTIQLF
jgi:hypothetical protein